MQPAWFMAIPILFVSSYVGLGGGETALLALAQHLDPARFQPHLLLPYDGQLGERWRESGWPVHITPWRGATVYFVPSLWAQFPITYRIERLIREHQIGVIHSDYHTLPMAIPAAERTEALPVWTCWGWWFHPKPWQRSFFRRTRATFFPSRAIRDGFLGSPPFMPEDSTQLLYPGVDTARFQPGVDGLRVRFEASIASDAPVVALIARFQNVKGHDVFQAMVRQVALQIPSARFIVAGENVHGVSADEAYKQWILRAAETDPILRERLTYLGFRADSERVIGAADVVVCSSHFESYGMVNVEAMACGKPVVSTNRGGPSETVVHGETGFLIEPGDAGGLAQHVIKLLRDADLRARMGAAGRARVEQHFSAQATAGKFMATVDRLLADQ
jgi:glycosyltransferase involved in cell wall biosynthesis